MTEPTKDPVAVGLGALGAGLGLGSGVLTFSLLLVRALQHAGPAGIGDTAVETSSDILLGLFAGIAVAAFFGWRRSRGIENIFQRGAIAVIAAFGSLMIGFLVTPAVDHFLGLGGLIGLCVVLLAAGIASGLWACRAGPA